MTIDERIDEVVGGPYCWNDDKDDAAKARSIILIAASQPDKFLVPSVKEYEITDNYNYGDLDSCAMYDTYLIENESMKHWILELFLNRVEVSYYHAKKWIMSFQAHKFVPWTKDYAMIYVHELFPGLTTVAYNKIYQVVSCVAIWPKEYIHD